MPRPFHFYFFLVLSACDHPPDFDAYCSKVAACGGKRMDACLSESKTLYAAQKERGCGAEGAKMKECEAAYGACVGGAFDPTEECVGPIKELERCLDRTQGK